MADEIQNPTPNPTPEAANPAPAPAEKPQDQMIPKGRFDEVNAKFKDVATKLEELLAEKANADKAAKEQQGKFEELYKNASNDLTKYQTDNKVAGERVTQLESVINGLLEAKLDGVPEDFRDLVPGNLPPEAKLDWLAAAEKKGLFGSSKKETPIGESTNPAQTQTTDLNKLSPIQLLRAAYGSK